MIRTMLERLRQWLRKPRGIEATEPPRPNLTAEEEQLADEQIHGEDEEPGGGPTRAVDRE